MPALKLEDFLHSAIWLIGKNLKRFPLTLFEVRRGIPSYTGQGSHSAPPPLSARVALDTF